MTPAAEASTGGGSAAAAPVADLPSYAPAGVTDPTGCFYIIMKGAQKGSQCKRKRAPYDCVCDQHAVLGKRPAGAPLPCPPGHTLHPEPAHFPADIAASILPKLLYYDNLSQELVTEILAAVNTVMSMNPVITHPIALQYSHHSHTQFQKIQAWAQALHDNYIGWKITRTIQQNQAVPVLLLSIRVLRRVMNDFMEL